MERPPQKDRACGHPDDDLRTRRPGRTCRSADPFVRQPLHGAARTKHSRRHPRRADGALPLHARLLRRSHRSVLLPLAPGEQVRVIKGPLTGLEGELVTINGKSKVAVRLDMLGCAHVDMPVGFVERVGKMEAVR